MKNKMKILDGFWAVVIGCLLCTSTFAHDHWVEMDEFRPSVGTEIEILICAGHSFPKASQDANPKVPYNGYVVQPNGVSGPLQIIGESSRKSIQFTFSTNGTYIVTLVRQRPGAEEPHYWSRTIITTKGGKEDTKLYRTNKDLEIVPVGKLSGLKKNDRLPLTVLYNGHRINALLAITTENAKTTHIRTSPRRPASLKISGAGRYLAVASIKGKKCSLTFVIPKSEE